MAKFKCKVIRVTPVTKTKSLVIAVNADDLHTEKVVDEKGNELSAAAVKKLKPEQIKKRRVPTGADRLSISYLTETAYKVDDIVTITI